MADGTPMKFPVRLAASAVMAGLSLVTAACGTVPARTVAPALPPLAQFCSAAQAKMAHTALPVENLVIGQLDEFAPSKATIRPLQTRQYNDYADVGTRSDLRQISCKMKTADHIRTEYGASAAGEEGLCADVNRSTLAGVLLAFSADERRRLRYAGGTAIVFDAEQVTTNGREWLAPYPLAWQAPDGTLHIMAKAQRNDWQDPRWVGAPPQFRGTRYCHFIAPDYLRRILLGERQVGTTPPSPLGPPIR